MFGHVTALGGFHVTGEYRDRRMQHTYSRHAAWNPDTLHRIMRGTLIRYFHSTVRNPS